MRATASRFFYFFYFYFYFFLFFFVGSAAGGGGARARRGGRVRAWCIGYRIGAGAARKSAARSPAARARVVVAAAPKAGEAAAKVQNVPRDVSSG